MTSRMWPVDAPVTQRFAQFPNTYQPDGHTGMDFGCPRGTPLRAPAAGVVMYANWAQGLGWPNPYWIAIDFDGPANGDQSAGIVLVIDHRPYGLPFISIMAHLDQTGLEPGMHVRVGELVGQTGNTGRSSGPHLHFEVLPDRWNVNAKYYGRINPELFIGYSNAPDPEAAYLLGVDVASYQAGIDFNPLTADFAIVKITGGTSYVNPVGNAQYVNARAAGTRRGIYHYAREEGYGKSTADAEAEHFLAHARQYLDGNTLIALDWEGDNVTDTGWALRWLQLVESRTGLKPWIYMNQSTAFGQWDPVIRNGNPLWLAKYAVMTQTQGYNLHDGTFAPMSRAPDSKWQKPVCWQFSSTAVIPGWGGRLDANVFYGGSAAWLGYCRPFGAGGATADMDRQWLIDLFGAP